MQCNLNILSHMYTHTSLLFVLPDNKQGCYCIAQCLIPVLSTCVHTLFPSPASASNSACSFYYLFPPFTEVARPEWTMTLSFYCHHESWNSSIYIFVCSYKLIMVTQHQCYCYNGRSWWSITIMMMSTSFTFKKLMLLHQIINALLIY